MARSRSVALKRDYKKNSPLQPAVEAGCGMALLSHLQLTAQGTGGDGWNPVCAHEKKKSPTQVENAGDRARACGDGEVRVSHLE